MNMLTEKIGTIQKQADTWKTLLKNRCYKNGMIKKYDKSRQMLWKNGAGRTETDAGGKIAADMLGWRKTIVPKI